MNVNFRRKTDNNSVSILNPQSVIDLNLKGCRMVNARLCETARLMSFLGARDLFSLAKEMETREGIKEKFETTRPLKFG